MSTDNRIRELCARVVAADDADFSEAIETLRQALHEHAEAVRAMAAIAFQLADPHKVGQ
ncbi:MAG TPA: hypothetical protein VIW68_02425 [Candidatus Sulfotelmatobacter sp.]